MKPNFHNPEESHAHSLKTLDTLYQFDDMMSSIDTLVDMGCGNGSDLAWWATRTTRDLHNPRSLNIECTGIDLLPNLASCHRYRNLRYQPQDFEQPIDVKRGLYDVIWCHDAFQYVLDPFKTLRQWREATNPGGMLILVLPQTTNLYLNREHFEQVDGCYWHWTLVNLIHVLAVSGWDCAAGFFQKLEGDSWITAIVYRSDREPVDPRQTRWYDLCDMGMLPDSAVRSIQRHGHLRQQDLVLPWIDKSLAWIGRP